LLYTGERERVLNWETKIATVNTREIPFRKGPTNVVKSGRRTEDRIALGALNPQTKKKKRLELLRNIRPKRGIKNVTRKSARRGKRPRETGLAKKNQIS